MVPYLETINKGVSSISDCAFYEPCLQSTARLPFMDLVDSHCCRRGEWFLELRSLFHKQTALFMSLVCSLFGCAFIALSAAYVILGGLVPLQSP